MQLSSGVISIDSNAVFSGKTTDDLSEGSTNLYYTNARADARVNLQTGNNLDLSSKSTSNLSEGTNLYYTQGRFDTAFSNKTTSDLTEGTNLYYTTARANTAITDFDGNLTPTNLTASNNIEGVTLRGTGATGLVVTGNATIGGNLDVTGNINSETVVDLFVEDRNITMQYGATGTPSANSQIFIDRGDESNTYIKWDEANDKWKISNDGTVEYEIVTEVYTGNISPGNINITPQTYTGGLPQIWGGNVDNNNFSIGVGREGGANLPTGEILFQQNVIADNNVHITYKADDHDFEGNLEVGGNVVLAGDLGANVALDADALNITNNDLKIYTSSATQPVKFMAPILVSNIGGTPGSGNITIENGAFTTNLGDINALTGNLALGNADNSSAGQIRSAGRITTKDLVSNTTISAGGLISTTGNISGANILGTFRGDVDSNANITTTAHINTTDPGFGFQGNISGTKAKLGYLLQFDNDFPNHTGVGNTSTISYTGTQPEGRINIDAGIGTYKTRTTDSTLGLTTNSGSVWTPSIKLGQYENDSANNSSEEQMVTMQNHFYKGAFGYPSNVTPGIVLSTTSAGSINPDGNVDLIVPGNIIVGVGNRFSRSELSSTNSSITFANSIVTSDSNITTTANVSAENVLTDHVISDSAQPLQLKGQTDGIEFDKTISSVESRIFDTDTTGYSLADADLGTANVTTASIPRILTAFYGTAGQSTLTCIGLAAASGIYTAFELAGGSFAYPNAYWNPNVGGVGASAQTSLEDAMGRSGTTLGGVAWAGLGNLSGWRIFDVTNSSTTYLMGVTGHITGISGNTVSLSEPLLNNVGGAVILIPGAFSSTQNFGMVMTGDASTNALTFDYALSLYNQYDLPETLSNVTVDRIAYGSDSTINLSNVVMRHIADVETGPDSAIKVPRSMLIGANVTPDLLSIGTNEALAATSTLGITIEQDGVTDFGPLETTPQMKLMLNNYKTNSLASQTAYPKWTEFLGQSGNATVDMPYLGAPNLNFKLLGGTKPAKAATSAGDIPGRITFNTLTGTGATGSDQFNPPASITTMVGGTGDLTAMANLDMYFQSTSATAYRNGPYVGSGQGSVASGSIPQTFLASKSGTTVLAANQAGSISLRPARDYADSGNASSYVDNRYADNLHEYHTFVDVGYENTAGRTGAKLTIQGKSGQTNGATPSGSDFNYDSVGEAVLRLKTHNSDSTTKSQWDIEANQASGNLSIINSLNEGSPTTVMHFDGDRVFVDEVLRLQNLTTTEINALSGPQAGDTVYNTTLNQVCFYNGTAWQKITSATM